MNVERINDFIDAYSKAIDLSDEHKGVLKEQIPKLVDKYSSQYPSISVKDDDYDKYPIKPVNGQYSLEDFFLNRLMRNVWDVDMINSTAKGHYDSDNMRVNFNEDKINKQLSKVLDSSRDDFNELNAIARKKVQTHEFGHALQTRFSKEELNLFHKAKYKAIIDELRKTKNGKYANEINTFEELDQRNSGKKYEKYISTGVHYSGKATGVETYRDVEGFDDLNEILNETEALELVGAKQQGYIRYDEKGSQDKTYFKLKNAESSNDRITNYGYLLKILAGEKATFEGMYLSPDKFFKTFNSRYNDIFQQEYGNDKSAIENVITQLKTIKDKGKDDKDYRLKLEGTLAKCFERKIENNLGKVDPLKLVKEANQFRDNTLWNEDPNILKNFEHAQILSRTVERIRTEYEKNNVKSSSEKTEDTNRENATRNTSPSQTSVSDKTENKKVESKENPKKRIINGFIQAYDYTEEEYQYEQRAKDEKFDIQRVKDIISTEGKNRMLLEDLDGKYMGTSGDDYEVQYSQKQVSAMARLLKAAELLTKDKTLNPKGIDYLEEFTNVPNIDYKLKEMTSDRNKEGTYMYEMKNKAIENRNNGTIPSYEPTDGEKRVSKGEQTLSIDSLKRDRQDSKVTSSEVSKSQQAIKDRVQSRTIDPKQSEYEIGD